MNLPMTKKRWDQPLQKTIPFSSSFSKLEVMRALCWCSLCFHCWQCKWTCCDLRGPSAFVQLTVLSILQPDVGAYTLSLLNYFSLPAPIVPITAAYETIDSFIRSQNQFRVHSFRSTIARLSLYHASSKEKTLDTSVSGHWSSLIAEC